MKKICILLLTLFFLTGCGANNSVNAKISSKVETTSKIQKANTEKKPYLTITETYHENEKNGDMYSRCIVYDIQTGKLGQEGLTAYTAGYPLSTYSRKFSDVFFSGDSGQGDQVYQYNNGECIKITDQFRSINYIIQCDDKLFVVASLSGHTAQEPFIVDPVSKECNRMFPDKNYDNTTWAVSTVTNSDSMLFSYQSSKEEYKNLDKKIDKTVRKIALLNLKTGAIKQIYKIKHYIHGIAGNKNKLYLNCSLDGVGGKHFYYKINLKTKKKKKFKPPITITGDMALWNNQLYCIGYKGHIRGIYSINLTTLKEKLICEQKENEFINGFSLNY